MKFKKLVKAKEQEDWTPVLESYIKNLEEVKNQCVILSNDINKVLKFFTKHTTKGDINISYDDIQALYTIMGKLQDIAEGKDSSLRNVIKSLGISHK